MSRGGVEMRPDQRRAAAVHVVLPANARDLDRPSGGHIYNQQVCRGLASLGWSVIECALPGDWPWPNAAARRNFGAELAALPDGALVLIDGLIGSAAADITAPAASRLSLVVLVHMPLGEQFPGHQVAGARACEARTLQAAGRIVVTSRWSKTRLLERYSLPADSICVAVPGAPAAPLSPGTPGGGELLFVGTVAPHKGPDVLLAALAPLTGRAWRCRLIGPPGRDAGFVERLQRRAGHGDLRHHVNLTGAARKPDLDAAYRVADLVVLPSYAETYGMVVTEALAHGLPVIGSNVGGVPEALGRTLDGRRPGILVPAGDKVALSGALRAWLAGPAMRAGLRRAARDRRSSLTGWDATCRQVSGALAEVSAGAMARGNPS